METTEVPENAVTDQTIVGWKARKLARLRANQRIADRMTANGHVGVSATEEAVIVPFGSKARPPWWRFWRGA